MRGHRPQMPGLHVAECACAQSDNNNMSMSDVRVRSTLREEWLSGSSLGTTEWQHQVAVTQMTGAND